MAADGVPNAPLTCSAYQHASRTCSKSVVPSLANIGAVVASSPFASAMPWSVGVCKLLVDGDASAVAQKEGAPTFSADVCPSANIDSVHNLHGASLWVDLVTQVATAMQPNPCRKIRSRAAIRGRTLCSGSTPHRQRPSSTRLFCHPCTRDLHEAWCFAMRQSSPCSHRTSAQVLMHYSCR